MRDGPRRLPLIALGALGALIALILAGIYIYRRDEAGRLRAGQEIEMSGQTIEGLSGPVVQTEKIKILGQRAMPVPRVVSADELLDGQYDGQWVEVVVHTISHPRRRADCRSSIRLQLSRRALLQRFHQSWR